MKDFTIEQIQAICERAFLPTGIPMVDARLEGYGIQYSGNHPYYAALRDITRDLCPEVVVEIGTWQGTSAVCFAAGAPDALVLTMDHHSDPGDELHMDKVLEAAEAFPNLLYLQGCSTQMVADEKPGTLNLLPEVQKILGGRSINILFIDGWHVAKYAKADWDAYVPMLSSPGLVIMDDLLPDHSAAIQGMRDLFNSLPGEKYLDGRIHPGFPMGFVKL